MRLVCAVLGGGVAVAAAVAGGRIVPMEVST